MIWEVAAFLVCAFVTWRLTRSSYNQFAHWLNAGLDNEAITHESQLERLLTAAGRYYDEAKWVAAEKAYFKVLKFDHKNLTAYRRLGMVYSHLKNYADARECFEFVIKAAPQAGDWQNYATILFHQKEYPASAEAMQRSLELEPTLARFLALARLCELTDAHMQQFEALAAAHELQPDDSSVMLLLARWHDRYGTPDQAKHWRQRAVSHKTATASTR